MNRQTISRRVAAWRVAAVVVALVCGSMADASADAVARLSQTLLEGRHHKARMSAAVSLGQLDSKRSVAPLVKALRDEHYLVRAVAAAALGDLGDRAALPALKRATRDAHPLVRKRAVEAISAIRNGRRGKRATRASAAARDASRATPGFGDEPRALAPTPEVYVVLASTVDRSAGAINERQRKRRGARMRALMTRMLQATPEIATDASAAAGLSRYNLDASVTRLGRAVRKSDVLIECEIRVAISNARGKMLSFVTHTARMQVSMRAYRSAGLNKLYSDAIDGAIKGAHRDVIEHLLALDPK